jgi:alpha-L-glutamate ligase-like protein
MIVSSVNLLGLNARNRLFLSTNKKEGRRIADSKLLTKRVLRRNHLATPAILAVFRTPKDIMNFSWETLPDNFVLKPSKGFGGQGVMIVKKKAKWAGEWYLMDGSIITVQALRFHALEILSGRFSLHNSSDIAFIEERIKIQKIFAKYVWHGVPDIRVVVFNKVPVAAMLRLPTRESQGKSNLHQGAIGVGIDLATGITTNGFLDGHFIKYIPETKRKINGLKIPNWSKILLLAVQTQEVTPSLGYLGVDIVLDKNRGPMILELNARPGLEIQNANLTALKKRLERIEGLEIKDAEHGVRIAKALFASRFADQVMAKEGIKTIKIWEKVKIVSVDKQKVEIEAKIDTGAWKTSIDKDLAERLGILKSSNILWTKIYKSSLGEEKRQVINLTFYLAGRKIETIANIASRKNLRTPLIIGRRDLEGFLIKPERN